MEKVFKRLQWTVMVENVTVSTLGVLLIFGLMREVFFALSAQYTGYYVLLSLVVLAVAGLVQVFANTTYMRPIRLYARVYDGQHAAPTVSVVQSVATIAGFSLSMGIAGYVVVYTGDPDAGLVSPLVLLGGVGGLAAGGLWGSAFVVAGRRGLTAPKDATPASLAPATVKALAMFPLKAAGVSFGLYLLAGAILSLGFAQLRFTPLHSLYIAILVAALGMFALPLQFFLFRGAVRTAAQNLGPELEDVSFDDEAIGYRFGLYPQLITGIGGLLVACVLFLVVLAHYHRSLALGTGVSEYAVDTLPILNDALDLAASDPAPAALERLVQDASGATGMGVAFFTDTGAVIAEAGDMPPWASWPGRVQEASSAAIALKDGAERGVLMKWTLPPADPGAAPLVLAVYAPPPYLLGSHVSLNNEIIFFGACIVLVAIFVGVLVARDLSRPIRAVVERTREFSAGRFDRSVVTLPGDEVGELWEDFRAMAESIGDEVARTRRLTEQIETAVADLGQVAQDILQASSEQSVGAEEQAAAMQEVATTSTEVAAVAKSIAESAKLVEAGSMETVETCKAGSTSAERAAEQFEKLTDQVEVIASSVMVLAENMKRVHGIITIIDEISDQVGLLALNATIEAAGAEEKGVRFGVVAEEIGRLARGTRDATQEITQLVDEIQRSTQEVVTLAGEGSEMVEVGYGLADQIRTAIADISTAAERTTETAKGITFSTGQQTSSSEQMARTISEISSVAEESIVGAKRTVAGVEGLRKLAERLEELVLTEQASGNGGPPDEAPSGDTAIGEDDQARAHE